MTKNEELEELHKLILKCKNCRLGTDPLRKQAVSFRGNLNAKIMLVGEAPGLVEEERGLPFCGPAGLELGEILREIGLDPKKEVFISNIVKCRSRAPVGSGRQNLPPTSEIVEKCRKFIEAEIAIVEPKIIVPLGSSAIRLLLNVVGTFRVKEYVGSQFVFKAGEKEYNVFPTYHPAAQLHAGKGSDQYFVYRNKIKDHIIKAIELCK